MRGNRYVLSYAFRILVRKWSGFVLPFLSLTFTAMIIMTVLMVTNSSSRFLEDQSKELQGGDVVVETNYVLPEDVIEKNLGLEGKVIAKSLRREFSGTVSLEGRTTPVSFSVIDESHPLYGEVILENSEYRNLLADEIYLSQNAKDKLGVSIGERVSYGSSTYRVVDFIVREPTSLLASFRFLPTVLMSNDGFAASGLSEAFLRMEYEYGYKTVPLSKDDKELVAQMSKESNLRVDIAGQTSNRFIRGLENVEQFVLLAILLSCVLASVNIYVSVMYVLRRLRKSFALLLVLGATKLRISAMLFVSLMATVLLALALGVLCATIVVDRLLILLSERFLLSLPSPDVLMPLFVASGLVVTTSIASFAPALYGVLRLKAKTLLFGEDEEKHHLGQLVFVTLSTFIPLFVVASVLFESFFYGGLIICVIFLVYTLAALFFRLLIKTLYVFRHRMSFFFRAIIAQKKGDGLFGVVSMASLYVALSCLSILILIQVSLTTFLKDDLARTIPTSYFIDVQGSQVSTLRELAPSVTLFPNVGGRIISIDGRNVQEGITRGDESIPRELGREYNLTYRTDLISSESLIEGVWHDGASGEVSVDKEFAKRAAISLGSQVVFLVQGFEVITKVTSLRETDSRSGLPFFYFVLAPSDMERFPATYFGYDFLEKKAHENLALLVSAKMPNVSVIDTQEIGKTVDKIIKLLLVLVLFIAFPPLVLAVLLVTTLIVTSLSSRKREAARLMALGMSSPQLLLSYVTETTVGVLLSQLFAYATGVITVYFLVRYYLELKTVILYDHELILGLAAMVGGIIVFAYLLWRSDMLPLRERLHNEHE